MKNNPFTIFVLRILYALIFLFCLKTHATPLLSASEPVYQNKRLTEWLQDLDYTTHTNLTFSQQKNLTAQARTAIVSIGSNAVPWLIDLLRCEDSSLRTNFIAWTAKKKWIKFKFRPPAKYFQQMGLNGIEIIGPLAASAEPDILHLTTNKNDLIRASAMDSLSRLGPISPQAGSFLWQNLDHPNFDIREAAIQTLSSARFCPPLPVLQKHLSGPFTEVRFMAMDCLTNCIPDKSVLIPIYIDKLKDPFFNIRWEAIFNLGNLGKSAESAVPALQKMDQDPNRLLRQAAIDALHKIAGEPVTPVDFSSGTIRYIFPQMPLAQVLDEYKRVAGKKLIIAPGVQQWLGFTCKTLYPVSQNQAKELLEDEMLAQGGIHLTDNGDGTISVTQTVK